MGFECVYYYHEKIDGEYNKEEKKTFKKKVGDPFDDVPLEKLALSIMSQMARRDIWIVDVEISELTKKAVNFKESKGGIILKNKKFLFDGTESSISVEEITCTEIKPTVAPSVAPPQQVNIQGQSQLQPHEININRPRRAIDNVMFLPEPGHIPEIRQKNIRLTPDKKYQVFEKKSSPVGGEIFLIQDDLGREQWVSDKFFVPGNVNLIADSELDFSQKQKSNDSGRLLWGNTLNADMPDLRKR